MVEGNIVEGNRIHSDHEAGGYFTGLSGVVRNNVFRNNSILENWGWGGGVIVDGDRNPDYEDHIFIELSGNAYEGNSAPSGGSAIFIDEGANARIRNELIIQNSTTDNYLNAPILVDGPRGTTRAITVIENCTIADNTGGDDSYGHGVAVTAEAQALVRNSIFFGNGSTNGLKGDFFVAETSSLIVEYSIYEASGEGDFSITHSQITDPLFANPSLKDYHLKSVCGRWNTSTGEWVRDSAHSPGIDAGNPSSQFHREPEPNGARVNLGAYGNTPEASMSR